MEPYCTKCRQVANEAGRCPKCKVQLDTGRLLSNKALKKELIEWAVDMIVKAAKNGGCGDSYCIESNDTFPVSSEVIFASIAHHYKQKI